MASRLRSVTANRMEAHMQRRVLLVLLATTVAAGMVYAANVHFKNKPAVTATDNGLTLTTDGALTGLGYGDVTITVTATATPKATCSNQGGNKAAGQNPAAVNVSGVQTFPASAIKNGNLS